MSAGTEETKFGSFYIGAIFAQTLYGIAVLQTYLYVIKYPRDDFRIKLLIFFLWTLVTAQVAFTCHITYHYQVTGFGRPQWRSDGVWSIFATMGLNVAIMAVVQCFFVKHIYRLSKPPFRRWLIILIISLIIAQTAFGIQTVTEFFMKKQFSRLHEANPAAIPFRVTNVVANAAISTALCVLLGRRHLERHDDDINLIIYRPVIFVAARFLMVTFVSVIDLILSLVSPDSFYGAAVDLMLGQVYVNTFLATLNSRDPVRGRGVPNINVTTRNTRGRTQPTTIAIEMGTIADSSVADIDGQFGLHTDDFCGTATTQSSSYRN